MENVYIGRQPVIDNDANLCAYEILYRDSKQENHIDSSRYASASVINSVLNKFGTRSLLGHRRAFVKVDEKFLMHDLIFTIPQEFFIFSILQSVEMSERVVERMEQLYAKDYKLAINDIFLSKETFQKYKIVFKELSYIKIRIDDKLNIGTKKMVSEFSKNNIIVVATKIEELKEYELAKSIHCDWYQGYFFAEPKIMENAKYEPSQMKILKLYNLLLQDTNIDELTTEFEDAHEITVQLLQFINSGAFHFRNRISSIHHILTLVGRIPLAQWLMLMIYSKSVAKGNDSSPLMLMVKYRTELMENILKVIEPNVKNDMLGEAYFVGVLSLIDTVFGVELATLLEDMHISQEVEDALLKEDGILGEIFVLVKDIEMFNTSAVEAFEVKYSLPCDAIENIAIQSMEDVNNFESPIVE